MSQIGVDTTTRRRLLQLRLAHLRHPHPRRRQLVHPRQLLILRLIFAPRRSHLSPACYPPITLPMTTPLPQIPSSTLPSGRSCLRRDEHIPAHLLEPRHGRALRTVPDHVVNASERLCCSTRISAICQVACPVNDLLTPFSTKWGYSSGLALPPSERHCCCRTQRRRLQRSAGADASFLRDVAGASIGRREGLSRSALDALTSTAERDALVRTKTWNEPAQGSGAGASPE